MNFLLWLSLQTAGYMFLLMFNATVFKKRYNN